MNTQKIVMSQQEPNNKIKCINNQQNNHQQLNQRINIEQNISKIERSAHNHVRFITTKYLPQEYTHQNILMRLNLMQMQLNLFERIPLMMHYQVIFMPTQQQQQQSLMRSKASQQQMLKKQNYDTAQNNKINKQANDFLSYQQFQNRNNEDIKDQKIENSLNKLNSLQKSQNQMKKKLLIQYKFEDWVDEKQKQIFAEKFQRISEAVQKEIKDSLSKIQITIKLNKCLQDFVKKLNKIPL